MLKLAISGYDGIGKTQQIRLSSLGTSKFTHRLKRLAECSGEWPALSETALHKWWFKEVEFNTLSRIIIDALNTRNASCIPNKVNVFDRGTIMFKAVLAATFLTRNIGCIEDAYIRVDNLFSDLLDYTPDEYELLLVPDVTYQQRIKPLIQITDARIDQYIPEQLKRYAVYQKYLSHTIDHYYSDAPQNQKIVVNSCILDIQNKIRSKANNTFDIKLPKICENFERGITLGGLSESGKSSFANILSQQYGFYRLKLRYFEDILIRAERNVNAEHMGFEFASFLHCHPHVTRASVESIHDPILPAYFKLLFGDRIKIVFLSVPEELRIGRTATETGLSVEKTARKVREKDEIKRSRGAHIVENIADLVFDNTADGIEEPVINFVRLLGLKP